MIKDIEKHLKDGVYEGNVYTNIAEDVAYLISLVKKQREAIKDFTNKNFHGGSKSDREDYAVMVSCADIYKLREALKEELIQDKESITTIQRMTIEESKKRYPDHIFFTGKEE